MPVRYGLAWPTSPQGRGNGCAAHPVGSSVTLPLSVLDLSPIASGRTPSSALHESIELARTAEAAGYQRFWVAEHHNIPSVASSAPEVMIASVAAATSTIRVGAGGIMLPNHAPLKVAETFRVLEALHPGRIDLGHRPGTGHRPAHRAALRRSREALMANDFPAQFAELRGYVDGFPDDHPFAPIVAQPTDVPLPPGLDPRLQPVRRTGGRGVRHRVRLRRPLRRRGPGGGDRDLPRAVPPVRPPGRPDRARAILAVSAIAAETAQRADQLALAAALSMVRLRSGHPGPLPSPEEAAALPVDRRGAAHGPGVRPVRHRGRRRDGVRGHPGPGAHGRCRRADGHHRIHDPAERRRSYVLLSEAARTVAA